MNWVRKSVVSSLQASDKKLGSVTSIAKSWVGSGNAKPRYFLAQRIFSSLDCQDYCEEGFFFTAIMILK
jgi:hypothetical protein